MSAIVERWHPDNTTPKGNWVFVFGSNLAGRHGAGAAKQAHVSFGAQYKIGRGLTGSAYAIPTKDASIQSLTLTEVQANVEEFIAFAKANPKRQFFVTRVGCGLAGFKDEDIAPMFKNAPVNCSFAQEWFPYFAEQKIAA